MARTGGRLEPFETATGDAGISVWARRRTARIMVSSLLLTAVATVVVAEPLFRPSLPSMMKLDGDPRTQPERGSASSPPQRASEEVLQRTFLPSPRNIQGEFRWIRRGDQWVAQTVLHTTSLRRAIQKIRRKELARWPRGISKDAATYLGALAKAKDVVLGHSRESGGRRQLLIEVGFDSRLGFVAFYEIEMLEVLEDSLTMVRGDQLELLTVSLEYARGAVEKQVVEAFGESSSAFKEILEKR